MGWRTDVVRYGTGALAGGGEVPLRLSLCRPLGADGALLDPDAVAGLVVLVHGGGFDSGRRDAGNLRKIARDFAREDYVVASIDYRLLDHDDPAMNPALSAGYAAVAGAQAASAAARGGRFAERFPAEFVHGLAAASEDLAAALRWATRGGSAARDADGDGWPDDPSRGLGLGPEVKTAVLGFSAGAMAALNVAYGLDPWVDAPRIDGVVALSGALPDPALPVGQAGPDLLVVHGALDRAVDPGLVLALEQEGALPAGIPYRRIELADVGHRSDRVVATDAGLFGQVLGFVDGLGVA